MFSVPDVLERLGVETDRKDSVGDRDLDLEENECEGPWTQRDTKA